MTSEICYLTQWVKPSVAIPIELVSPTDTNLLVTLALQGHQQVAEEAFLLVRSVQKLVARVVARESFSRERLVPKVGVEACDFHLLFFL